MYVFLLPVCVDKTLAGCNQAVNKGFASYGVPFALPLRPLDARLFSQIQPVLMLAYIQKRG